MEEERLIKFASFKYNTNNIGDEIQTLAAEQFLPRVDVRFDRDKLRFLEYRGEKYFMIFNGWFSQTPNLCFPPPDWIIPIFFSFHIAKENKKYFLNPESLQYLKKHEPIGCRDNRTMELLHEKGVKAYFSNCLSLTLPKRKNVPKNGKVFLVDVPFEFKSILSKKNHINIELVEHYVNNFDSSFKFEIAKQLLEKYRNEAKLILTYRLHCALPCLAMGIPVIFFCDKNEYRTQILEDMGIKVYSNKIQSLRWLEKIFKNLHLSIIFKSINKKLVLLKYRYFTPLNHKIDFQVIEDTKKGVINNIGKVITEIMIRNVKSNSKNKKI